MKKHIVCARIVPLLIFGLSITPVLADQQNERPDHIAAESAVMKVIVKAHPNIGQKQIDEAKGVDKEATESVELEFVTYNLDRSLFVGYYQHGWFEMVSLHDAKTKKQLGYISCEGGAPGVFRFSKDSQFLGAKTKVGWYVWKIPSFEEVMILGGTNYYEMDKQQEAAGPVAPK